MKKKAITFIAGLILMLFVSCAPQETNTSPINQNDYLFAVANNTVYKYNIESGVRSPLCRDPLCKHSDTQCPFYGIGEEIFKLENKIVYYKDNKIFAYDLNTNITKVASSALGNIYYPYLVGDKIYYNAVVFDYSPAAKHTVTVDLFCFCFSNEETKQLNSEQLYDMQRIQGIQGDRIVWYDNGLQSLYTTDFNYDETMPLNEEYYGIIAGNNSYRLRITSSSPVSFDLYRKQDGKDITALQNIVSVKGYNDSLIATYNNDNGRYIGQALTDTESLTDIYEYQSNDIYIYDSYGNNERKLCSIPDDYIIYSLSPTKITLSNGDHIGVQLKEYEFDAKGYVIGYKASVNMAIINIVTGTCVISRGK